MNSEKTIKKQAKNKRNRAITKRKTERKHDFSSITFDIKKKKYSE